MYFCNRSLRVWFRSFPDCPISWCKLHIFKAPVIRQKFQLLQVGCKKEYLNIVKSQWTCRYCRITLLLQWRIQGGRRRHAPPPWVQILSFWHTNFSKRSRLRSWRPPLRGQRPPMGNPGSATVLYYDCITCNNSFSGSFVSSGIFTQKWV